MQRTNLWRQIFGWAALVISSAALVSVLYTSLVWCPPPNGRVQVSTFGSVPTALAFVEFAVLCILIVTYRPENRIGWLCGVISLGGAIPASFGNYQYSPCFPTSGPLAPELTIGILVSTILFLLVILLLMFTLLPLWFPSGQFLSPRWRAVWYISVVLAVGSSLIFAFSPGALEQLVGRPITSPLELDISLPAWLVAQQRYVFITALVMPLIANASLVVRYRRADAVIRQQLKVFGIIAVGGVVLLILVELAGFLGFAKTFVTDWGYLFLLTVGWLGYPTAIGVAVLRYRLYDIEVIIRRTLVYGIVTALLVAMYFGLVILLQRIFSSVAGVPNNDLVTVVSTLAIAALFVPVRNRVQGVIDRRFNRKKYDAQQVLAKFGETVRDETDLEKLTNELVNVVEETMQPKSVSLWLRK